jgi:DNA-binding GntR family transcriptional regulator
MTAGTPWELLVSEHRQMAELVVMLRSLGDDPSTEGLCEQLSAMIDEHVARERSHRPLMPCLDDLADATVELCAGGDLDRVAAALARHVEAQEHQPDRQLGEPFGG